MNTEKKDCKNVKFGEKQCENIAKYYLQVYKKPLEYTVQGMNNVIKSLDEKLQKVLEIKFLTFYFISLDNEGVGYRLGYSRTYASNLMRDIMTIFNKEETKAALLEKPYTAPTVVYSRETSIEELQLSTRPAKVLKRANISNIGELLDYGYDNLVTRRNCGITSITEIQQKLANVGIEFKSKNEKSKEKPSTSKSIVENDKDLLNEHTVIVDGGKIEVYNHEFDSSDRITIEYNTYYDEKEPALITMSAHQCELFIELMKKRLKEIK